MGAEAVSVWPLESGRYILTSVNGSGLDPHASMCCGQSLCVIRGALSAGKKSYIPIRRLMLPTKTCICSPEKAGALHLFFLFYPTVSWGKRAVFKILDGALKQNKSDGPLYENPNFVSKSSQTYHILRRSEDVSVSFVGT